MLELSLSTINTTLFISDREVFISKAAKNDLMYVRTFLAPHCYKFFKSKICSCAFFIVSEEHYSESSRTWNTFWEIVIVLLLLKIHRVDFLNQHTGLQIFNSFSVFSTIKRIRYPCFQGSIAGTINPPNPTSYVPVSLYGQKPKEMHYLPERSEGKENSGSSSEQR